MSNMSDRIMYQIVPKAILTHIASCLIKLQVRLILLLLLLRAILCRNSYDLHIHVLVMKKSACMCNSKFIVRVLSSKLLIKSAQGQAYGTCHETVYRSTGHRA